MEQIIAKKMRFLNRNGIAIIFVVTGGNGCGKSVVSKALLTKLPFHQSFNLGAITKTIRFLNEDITVTKLENFDDKNIDNLFTPIVQYSCQEYQKNGVNVVVDGVQINTQSNDWMGVISGGVILSVEKRVKLDRNDLPDTHFKRKIDIDITDLYTYEANDLFREVDNSCAFDVSFKQVLNHLNDCLDKQIYAISKQYIGTTWN